MGENKFTYQEFLRLLKTAKFQFIFKTKNYIYFITPTNYKSFNEKGFVVHNETDGKIEILSYCDIIEVSVDGKKYMY